VINEGNRATAAETWKAAEMLLSERKRERTEQGDKWKRSELRLPGRSKKREIQEIKDGGGMGQKV